MTRKALPLFACFALSISFLHAADKTVTIESARTTEYVKTEEGGEAVRFSGGVVISVKEKDDVSKISADEILYDKTRDTLEAQGNVEYEHTTGKTGSEKFKGDSFLYNLKKQEGIFLGGSVKQDTGRKDSDPYIIKAEITGKDASSTMAFKHGVLTTCDDDDPHWFIKASRIWLLPGNEIAIFNGIFFIGPLPVFYIPAFYYPADEMIFHPVFGFRNREGYFVQTTTYLFGRKPLPKKTDTDGGTSFADFLQGDTLKEQKRQGLFLENLKEDAKNTDPDYFKVMADAYSSLGYMAGFDGSFTDDKAFFKNLAFSGFAAYSRTLYPPTDGLLYSTYDYSGEQNPNSGWFYGQKLPFRYRANLSTSITQKPLSLSVNVPLISDPSFKHDFLDRSEDLNWFKIITDQNSLATGNNLSDETSYSWNINGSLTPSMPFTSPYLSTASVSSFATVMTFNSKVNQDLAGNATESAYSPERNFFYPELIKPEASFSFGGTLFSSESASDSSQKKFDSGGLANPFSLPPVAQNDKSKDEKAIADRFIPSAGISASIPTALPKSVWSIVWTLNPSVVEEIRYDASSWNGPKDIDWNNYASVFYQVKTDAKLSGSWVYDTDLFSVSSALNFSGTKQDHPWLSSTVYSTQTAIDTIKLSDYTADVYSISSTDSAKYVPFNRNPFLKPVSLSWDFTGTLYKTEFDGTASDPSWEKKTFKWTDDYVTAHTATGVAGVSLSGIDQKLKIVSNLPPLLGSYAGTLNAGWTFVSLTSTTKLYEKENATKRWFWDPLDSTLSWKLPFDFTLGQEYVYDIEESEPSKLSFTGGRNSLSAYYTLTNTIPYKLVEGSGWVLDGTDKSFIPTEVGMKFDNSSRPLKLYEWKNRIFLQTNLVSNLRFDLLRQTASSFDFTPSITLKIHKFLDFTFSSNSSNEVIARYFQQWMDLPAPLPGETNIAKDLINSMSFWDQNALRSGGFKLKTLTLAATHYLHDWTATLSTTIKPKLKTEPTYRYEFEPTITFVVQWNPISDIKTTIKSKEGTFSLNTTSKDSDDDTTD